MDILADIDRKKERIKPLYKTSMGSMYQGDCIDLLRRYPITRRCGKVQLILTSPPFPLNRKKKYGNFNGEQYLLWLKDIAPVLSDYLVADGSLVIELGNAWESGKPTMSVLPIKALLAFMEAANLHLCQEFICYNTARLPTPAQWVNIERIRVKDAFTRVWWMSPVERPKADNRSILKEYSKSMRDLLSKGTYNFGKRPSQHNIGKESFLKDNKGAIPPNVLVPPAQVMDKNTEIQDLEINEVLPIANTKTNDSYQLYCRRNNLKPHPARMPEKLAEFFIRFLTDKNDLVLDPFAGSNTVGAVAEKLNRRWISLELDTEYARTSEYRFK